MPSLYAFGNNPLYYFSQSGVSASTTGIADDFVQLAHMPFAVHSACVGAAYNNVPVTDTWIAVSNKGEIGYSTDLAGSWTNYYLDNGLVNIRRIILNQGRYIVIGAKKDPVTLSEKAVVYTTALGNQANDWYKAYESTDNHSMLFDCVALADTLISVGYKNGRLAPLILFSSDNGSNWTESTVDTSVIQGALYSVVIAGDALGQSPTAGYRLYLGGDGAISLFDFTSQTFYSLSDQFIVDGQKRPIYRMLANNSIQESQITTYNIVALQSNRVYYTANLFDWDSVQAPGYNFTSVAWCDLTSDPKWYLGVESMLNQYTGFTISTVPQSGGYQIPSNASLVGYNNGIQTHEFVIA